MDKAQTKTLEIGPSCQWGMDVSGLPDKGIIETVDGEIGYHKSVSGALVWDTNGDIVGPSYVSSLLMQSE